VIERTVIRTPENVEFEFERAGLASRAAAWLIDLGLIGALLLLVALASLLAGIVLGGLATAVLFLLAFAIQWGYFVFFEWYWDGRTPGKRALGIRTLQARGVRITFFQSALRNLLRIADFLPAAYLVGAATTLLDASGRRLGDIAAGTLVVRVRTSPMPSVIVPPGERYNSFVRDPAVRAAASRIRTAEREVMVALAMRRERLPLPVRVSLFKRVAAHLEALVGVPRPPIFSDEKYVLNLTAVVLDPAAAGRNAPVASPR
jgi:uncharacterized RDD family membrane protein YckC